MDKGRHYKISLLKHPFKTANKEKNGGRAVSYGYGNTKRGIIASVPVT